MFIMLKQYYPLFWQLVRLDIRTRYFNSRLGLLVIVLQPLVLLVIYTWVFGDLMRLKAHGSQDFSEYLLAGLIVFNALSEVLNRAPTIIQEKRELILNTTLPLLLIIIVPIVSSLVLELISVVLLLIWLVFQGVNPFSALSYYLLWLIVRLLWSSAGIAVLSILGVIIQDLRQVISAILGILLLISPVFYRLEQVPEYWKSTLLWNPLTHLVQGYQAALVLGQFNFLHWIQVLVASLLIWVLCFYMAKSFLPKVRYVL